jgi:hypothetical protein
MRRERLSASKPDPAVIEEALDALDADELRKLLRDMLLELDDRAHGRIVNEVIDRAARNSSAWTPSGPSDEFVASVVAFAEAAKRVGYADPSDVDGYLREAANAFLAKDYPAAFLIFRALLIPVSVADIDLGQHEMVDEVLAVDVSACAAQYVVSMYMTAAGKDRAKAVRAAIGDVDGVGHFWEPLREMERVAVEPLPELDDFLPSWRGIIEESVADERRSGWDTPRDRWLREVVLRMEGASGLANLARSTRRADDLRAWCRMLVEAGDWEAALAAYEEAAEIVSDKEYSRAGFLDGVALAAQELGRKDLPARLERAWRDAPSLLRLLRWLGSSGSKAVAVTRAREALDSCSNKAHRQRALLHVIVGNLGAAAKLLAAAPGLGWSDSEHPGHLVFPLFQKLLGATPAQCCLQGRHMDIDELERMSGGADEARIATPEVDDILEVAGIKGPSDVGPRALVCKAMRRAAENRVAGVTENKRRRHYGHAAQLVAACAALDPSSETDDWVAGVRAAYRRYPALQRELDDHLGRAS